MGSKSVGSLLIIISFAPISLASLGKPAAGFPKLAKEIGAKLIIINNEETDFDSIADLVIHEQIGKVFSNISVD